MVTLETMLHDKQMNTHKSVFSCIVVAIRFRIWIFLFIDLVYFGLAHLICVFNLFNKDLI